MPIFLRVPEVPLWHQLMTFLLAQRNHNDIDCSFFEACKETRRDAPNSLEGASDWQFK